MPRCRLNSVRFRESIHRPGEYVDGHGDVTAVLLLANWLDDLGGVQTATRSLAAALEARDVEVRLVSAFPPTSARRRSASSDTILFPRVPWRSIPSALRAVAGDTRWGRLDRAGRSRAARRLEALARGVDAVVAMDVFAAEIAAAARLPGTRRFLQYHNTFSNIDGTRDLERVLRLSSVFDGLVALTEADAEGFRSRTSLPVSTVPNALPIAVHRTRSPERLVVALGRYTPAKNFALLLEAWAGLSAEQRNGWKLELYGDGPERAALEQQGGPDASVMPPTGDAASVLDRAAVLVLPSQHEGLPMVLLEAMAADVSCVATRSSPGVEELLEGGAGWLVPIGDTEALGRSLAEAMGDPEQRTMRTRVAEGRLGRYAPASVAERWLELVAGDRKIE